MDLGGAGSEGESSPPTTPEQPPAPSDGATGKRDLGEHGDHGAHKRQKLPVYDEDEDEYGDEGVGAEAAAAKTGGGRSRDGGTAGKILELLRKAGMNQKDPELMRQAEMMTVRRDDYGPGWVYLIQELPLVLDGARTTPEHVLFKIGMSDKPDRRPSQLCTGNGRALRIQKKVKVNSMKTEEVALHTLFSHFGGPETRTNKGVRYRPCDQSQGHCDSIVGTEWFLLSLCDESKPCTDGCVCKVMHAMEEKKSVL
jgi:hypothetical protein